MQPGVTRALHAVIFDTLRREILSGDYPVGSTLPTESAFTQRFGVSRHTVRQALRDLKDAGLVEPRQGRGTVVLALRSPQQYVYRLNNINDMHDQLVESHYDPLMDIASTDSEPDALALLPEGDRWRLITGVRYPIGETSPICEFEIYIAERYDKILSHIRGTRGSIYSLIETVCHERLDDVHQLVGAFTSDARKGTRIGLVPGETGIEIRRRFMTMSGALCMLTYNRYPATRFAISMRLKRVGWRT